jgi:hypothetical protein
MRVGCRKNRQLAGTSTRRALSLRNAKGAFEVARKEGVTRTKRGLTRTIRGVTRKNRGVARTRISCSAGHSHPSLGRMGTHARIRRDVPRLAFNQQDAAAALGVSVDHFERHIKPDLPIVYSGALKLYTLTALQDWLSANSLRSGRRLR